MIKQDILLTTDSVIFDLSLSGPKVLLVQRKGAPFQGMWALPGGFLEEEEPLEAGALRELKEETGLVVEKLNQIRAFGTPGRDPRGRTVTIAFWGSVSTAANVTGSDDAADAQWFPLEQLPELAFDHKEILTEAIELALPNGNLN